MLLSVGLNLLVWSAVVDDGIVDIFDRQQRQKQVVGVIDIVRNIKQIHVPKVKIFILFQKKLRVEETIPNTCF